MVPLKLQLDSEHFSEQWNPSNERVMYKRGETPSVILGRLNWVDSSTIPIDQKKWLLQELLKVT